MRSIRLYPVVVKIEEKEKSLDAIIKLYRKGTDAVRQHILMLIHEDIAKSDELRSLKSIEEYKKNSPKAAPGQIRMGIYKDMFNSNTSLEGIIDLISLLGDLPGDEPSKLLTHLYSHFCCSESELSRVLRNAAIDAMGESGSEYSLRALLRYAALSDSDRTLGRVSSALLKWSEKIGKTDFAEKDELKEELKDVLSREDLPLRQYG